MSKNNPLELCKEAIDLGITYAEDRAFFTAAKKLEEAAKYMLAHAHNCNLAESHP